MISPNIVNFMMPDLQELIVPADNVANVIDEHSLLNALIILSNERYTTIPVLSVDSKLRGLISASAIIKDVIHNEGMDFDKLYTKKTSEIELLPAQTIYMDESFENIMNRLIKENFLCVLNHENDFIGILTRRTIMVHINRLLHNENLRI